MKKFFIGCSMMFLSMPALLDLPTVSYLYFTVTSAIIASMAVIIPELKR